MREIASSCQVVLQMATKARRQPRLVQGSGHSIQVSEVKEWPPLPELFWFPFPGGGGEREQRLQPGVGTDSETQATLTSIFTPHQMPTMSCFPLTSVCSDPLTTLTTLLVVLLLSYLGSLYVWDIYNIYTYILELSDVWTNHVSDIFSNHSHEK